jgi:hypothetical protein
MLNFRRSGTWRSVPMPCVLRHLSAYERQRPGARHARPRHVFKEAGQVVAATLHSLCRLPLCASLKPLRTFATTGQMTMACKWSIFRHAQVLQAAAQQVKTCSC